MLLGGWATLFSSASAASTPTADYLMILDGAPVGGVHWMLAPDQSGLALAYDSETFLRRGPVLTPYRVKARLLLSANKFVRRITAKRYEGDFLLATVQRDFAEEDGLIPASLAVIMLARPQPSCLPAVDEGTAQIGTACGRLVNSRIEGTLLGEPFVARVQGTRLIKLDFPGQRCSFALTDALPKHYAPPDFFNRGVPTEGLAAIDDQLAPDSLAIVLHQQKPLGLPQSASQTATPTKDGASIYWRKKAPTRLVPLSPRPSPTSDSWSKLADQAIGDTRDQWNAAQKLTRFVFREITDKRPLAAEHSAKQVWTRRRASCVGHARLLLALTQSRGLSARLATGLVAAQGHFWAHDWIQVEIDGSWYDVDPTEGEAPARAPRVLLASGTAMDGPALARLSMTVPYMRIEVIR